MIILIVAEKEEREDERRRKRKREKGREKEKERGRGFPCVGSKRLRVNFQNASVGTGTTRTCVQHARVLPVRTEVQTDLRALLKWSF